MSTASTITVNDGKATPLAHTLTPSQNKDGSGFTWYDNLVGIPVYEIKVWAKLKMGTPSTPTLSSVGVIQPVIRVMNGIVEQDHVNTAKTEFNFAPNATAAERADLYALQINALQHALIKEQTRDHIAMY